MNRRSFLSGLLALPLAGLAIKEKIAPVVLGRGLNYGHPLARGLVGCWLMNEGTSAMPKYPQSLPCPRVRLRYDYHSFGRRYVEAIDPVKAGQLVVYEDGSLAGVPSHDIFPGWGDWIQTRGPAKVEVA